MGFAALVAFCPSRVKVRGAMLEYLLVCFGSLFSIVDPFAVVPAFLALVGEQPREQQKGVALRASLTCWVLLSLFALAGELIFRFFGITLPAFKLAGGILLFLVGLEMMRARKSSTRSTDEEEAEANIKAEVGLIPIGIPLLCGPGAIATVMVWTAKAKNFSQKVSVFLAIIAVSALTFAVLRSAGLVARALGKTGINIIGRVMGLILAAVAMQFVLDGIHEALPALKIGFNN